jgi:hypothetical protein
VLAGFISNRGLFGLRPPPRCRLEVVPCDQLADELGLEGLEDDPASRRLGRSARPAGPGCAGWGAELDGEAVDVVVGFVSGKESRLQEAVHSSGDI